MVLATVTAVIGAAALLGVPDVALRTTAILFVIASAAFTAGVFLLVAVRDGGTHTPRARRVSSVATVVLFVISVAGFLLLINRTEVTDTRPVISAIATGDGPMTVSGSATANGLGATERISVKVVDQAATRFQAVAGTVSGGGHASVPFEIQVSARPEREIMIIAWLTDRMDGEPACDDSTRSLPEVACQSLAIRAPALSAPVLTLSPDLIPGARSVTISVAAVVGPDDGVQVHLWDRASLIHSFIARPDSNGRVNSSSVVPIHDNVAVLCAVAEVAAEASTKTVPDPCTGATFAQLRIPEVPHPDQGSSTSP